MSYTKVLLLYNIFILPKLKQSELGIVQIHDLITHHLLLNTNLKKRIDYTYKYDKEKVHMSCFVDVHGMPALS